MVTDEAGLGMACINSFRLAATKADEAGGISEAVALGLLMSKGVASYIMVSMNDCTRTCWDLRSDCTSMDRTKRSISREVNESQFVSCLSTLCMQASHLKC